jgi:hypothetical protein
MNSFPMGPWVWIAVCFVFQAGILFAAFRTMGKDVNGIGRKVGHIQNDNERLERVLAIQILLEGIPEDKRESYLAKVKMLLEK